MQCNIVIDNNIGGTGTGTDEPLYIYSTDRRKLSEGYCAYGISAEFEMDGPGRASFSVPTDNPNYSEIYPIRTAVHIFINNNKVWMGRVVSVSMDMYRDKMVNCEGCMAFYNDIIIPPFIYSGASCKRTIAEHISECYGRANNYGISRVVQISPNHMEPGHTDFPEFFDENQYYVMGLDSYSTFLDVLGSCRKINDSFHYFMGSNGGTLSIVYGSLPWNEVQSVIEFKKNLIDMTLENDGTDIYTSAIVVGKDGLKTSQYCYDSELVSEYGRITKTFSFDEIDTPEILDTLGRSIASKIGSLFGESDIEVTAFDMGLLEENYGIDIIGLGNSVLLKAPNFEINKKYVCTGISMDIDNPANTTYTLSPYTEGDSNAG